MLKMQLSKDGPGLQIQLCVLRLQALKPGQYHFVVIKHFGRDDDDGSTTFAASTSTTRIG